MRRGWPMGLAALPLLIAAAPAPPAAAPPPPDPALASLLRAPTKCARPGHPDEVIVCGHGRDREAERQRLPLPPERDDGDPRQFSVSRERNGLIEDRSGQGPQSCESAVGPHAEAGCLARSMERWHEQHPGNFWQPREPDWEGEPPPPKR